MPRLSNPKIARGALHMRALAGKRPMTIEKGALPGAKTEGTGSAHSRGRAAVESGIDFTTLGGGSDLAGGCLAISRCGAARASYGRLWKDTKSRGDPWVRMQEQGCLYSASLANYLAREASRQPPGNNLAPWPVTVARAALNLAFA